MPSPFLRLPQKTSGLFDTGFAGSASDAASYGVNAPATDPLSASVDEHRKLLADTESGRILSFGDSYHHHLSSSTDTSTLIKASALEQPAAAAFFSDVSTAGLGELEDPLADFNTDPLGDESLDAFINLDQLLMGDAFLDEVNEVKPVIEMTPHAVEPVSVISIPSPAGGDHQQLDFLDLLECTPEAVPLFQESFPSFIPAVEPAPPVPTNKGASRKRKATSKAAAGPVKTSLFEVAQPISVDTVTTTTMFTSPCSPELDHDYIAKSTLTELPLAGTSSNSAFEMIGDGATVESESGKGLTDKQSIRRHKNNIASKRSREQRKQKFTDLDREAEELVEKNEALKLKIAELEKIAKEMKAVLVAKMTGK